MGLQISKELGTGYEAGYVRIRSVSVVYELYKSHQDRVDGKSPITAERVVFENDDTNDQVVADGYTALKTITEFAGATDLV